MSSTSQENSNAASKLISAEDIEVNGDDDEDEENINDFLDQGNMGQLLIVPDAIDITGKEQRLHQIEIN